MVAIKDMEMPKDCKKCPLMGTDGNPKNLFSPMMCVAIWATTHEIKHCVEGKILDDCPLVEIEERKVGKWIDCGFIDKSFRQYKCSNCSNFVYEKEYSIKYHKHCLHCGAEMKQE